MKKSDNIVLFLGFGYTAQYLANLLTANGWQYLKLPSRDNEVRNNFLRHGMLNTGFPIEEESPKPQPKEDTKAPSVVLKHKAEVIKPDFQENAKKVPKKPKPKGMKASAESTQKIIDLVEVRKQKPKFKMSDHINEMISKATHIVVTAPPVKGEDPVLNRYIELIIERTPNLKWLGYLSATSVYGDYNGETVTELSECNPKSERGKNRLRVENLWQALAIHYDIPVHIFRLAGIYGPNRNTIKDVRTGNAFSIIKENHLTNRIYVKDLANALFTSMKEPTPWQIYNLSDNLPASTAALNDFISFLLNKPQLTKMPYDEIAHKLTAMQRSFYEENKIVLNTKFLETFNFKLNFPTYREGLGDILKKEIMSYNGRRH